MATVRKALMGTRTAVLPVVTWYTITQHARCAIVCGDRVALHIFVKEEAHTSYSVHTHTYVSYGAAAKNAAHIIHKVKRRTANNKMKA